MRFILRGKKERLSGEKVGDVEEEIMYRYCSSGSKTSAILYLWSILPKNLSLLNILFFFFEKATNLCFVCLPSFSTTFLFPIQCLHSSAVSPSPCTFWKAPKSKSKSFLPPAESYFDNLIQSLSFSGMR